MNIGPILAKLCTQVASKVGRAPDLQAGALWFDPHSVYMASSTLKILETGSEIEVQYKYILCY